MSDDNLPVATPAANFFDKTNQPDIPTLDQVPDLSEDDVLHLTRKLRLRQIAVDLDKNGGEMPVDPEERKIFLAQLKDLDSQATKIKMIGVKEKASLADREAAVAVARLLTMMGDHPMRRQPVEGTAHRAPPQIKDAVDLKPLSLVEDETQVGIDATTYDDLMERTGHG